MKQTTVIATYKGSPGDLFITGGNYTLIVTQKFLNKIVIETYTTVGKVQVTYKSIHEFFDNWSSIII